MSKILNSFISWDWKSSPSVDELQRALKPFGINVYKDPQHEGSDSFGYIFSNQNISYDELCEISDDYYGETYDD